MPYTASVTVPSVITGKILLVTAPDEDPLYSDVSPIQTGWMLGASVQIEEVWEVRVRVPEPKLVQIFREYPFDRYKLGNYNFVSTDNVPKSGCEDSGYLHYLVQRFSRSQFWTVGIDSGGLPVQDGVEEIDNCNFGTRETRFGFGGVSIAIQSPLQDESLFKLRKTAKPVRLKDTRVTRVIPRLGIYLFPGVELVDASYSMAAVNLLEADVQAFVPNSCSSLDPDCDAEFLEWRRTNFPADADFPGSFADGQSGLSEGTHIYSSFGAADAGGDAEPQEFVYTCSDGNTRAYFLANSF